MTALRRAAAALLALYRREPARCNQLAAAGLSWLVLKLGLDVDDATVLLLATSGLSIAAGELTRWLVIPVSTFNQVVADETRPFAEGGTVSVRVPLNIGEGGREPYVTPGSLKSVKPKGDR